MDTKAMVILGLLLLPSCSVYEELDKLAHKAPLPVEKSAEIGEAFAASMRESDANGDGFINTIPEYVTVFRKMLAKVGIIR